MIIKCAKADCSEDKAAGKSKYCPMHREAAREAFFKMISEQPSAADKAKAHEELFAKAHEAGMAAASKVTPVPMVVVQRRNPLDDTSPIVKEYAPVNAGVCGFAWVSVRPANSSFALWLKKTGKGRPNSYSGGMSVYCHEFGQSYELKCAYVAAFAGVLREAGLKKVYAMDRMD